MQEGTWHLDGCDVTAKISKTSAAASCLDGEELWLAQSTWLSFQQIDQMKEASKYWKVSIGWTRAFNAAS